MGMLPWQPAIVYCVMFDAMLLSDLANKFSLSLNFVWMSYVRLELVGPFKRIRQVGYTFPYGFASFNNPVAVTAVARSVVFSLNWASMRPYYLLRLIRST